MSEPDGEAGLPENAYRELAPGETYRPIVPASAVVAEITTRSIVFGLLMTALFSAAAAFISLKLGQGIESAIPIAILAIGYSAMVARKSTLLENVNIVTLGATAGIIVGGSTFTMPAIFILARAAVSEAWNAFVTGQVERVSPWAPLIWPYYSALATGLVALVLQVLAEMVRGQGGTATRVTRPFQPERGAYEHECGHDHGAHDHGAHDHGAHDHGAHDHAHEHRHGHDHGGHGHDHHHPHGHKHGH